MKWTLLSKPSADLHIFNLTENNSVKEVLRYNPLQQSARVSFSDRQRLFFIEKVSFRNNSFIFKNEYGFNFGKFMLDTAQANTGIIELEEIKLQFNFSSGRDAQLQLYKPDALSPLATCSLQSGDLQFPSLQNKQAIAEFGCLLMGLCWQLYKLDSTESGIHYKEKLTTA